MFMEKQSISNQITSIDRMLILMDELLNSYHESVLTSSVFGPSINVSFQECYFDEDDHGMLGINLST